MLNRRSFLRTLATAVVGMGIAPKIFLYIDENMLDVFWAQLPIEDKALAVQLYWDNSASDAE